MSRATVWTIPLPPDGVADVSSLRVLPVPAAQRATNNSSTDPRILATALVQAVKTSKPVYADVIAPDGSTATATILYDPSGSKRHVVACSKLVAQSFDLERMARVRKQVLRELLFNDHGAAAWFYSLAEAVRLAAVVAEAFATSGTVLTTSQAQAALTALGAGGPSVKVLYQDG